MQFSRKMSAQNMISKVRALGNRRDSKSPNEVKLAGDESKDKLYEPKHKQKLIRVLTVIAYLISVSFAAIILSLYYAFIWDPKDHRHYTVKQTASLKSENASLSSVTLSELGRNDSHVITDWTRNFTEISRSLEFNSNFTTN